MATITVTPPAGTSNAEGRLYKDVNDTWANRTTGTFTLSNPTTESFYFLDGTTDPNRKISRHWFKADFSIVPAGSTVTAVSFNFNARYGSTGTIETIVLALGTQSNTLATGDLNAFSTEYGRYQPSSASTALQTLNLNATGITAVAGLGTVKFAFISANDFDSSDPGAGNGNAGPIWRTPSDATGGQPPYFIVTYTPKSGGSKSNAFFM